MRTSTHSRVLVTGPGGFIGHHLVTALKQRGYWVRGVRTSLPEYMVRDADEFDLRDLRHFDECLLATLQGVPGRNSDNRRLREVPGCEPSVPLRQGLEPTYRWIEKQVTSRRPPWAATRR
jgi:nucleoside-diphosphate-sugar epimerase